MFFVPCVGISCMKGTLLQLSTTHGEPPMILWDVYSLLKLNIKAFTPKSVITNPSSSPHAFDIMVLNAYLFRNLFVTAFPTSARHVTL